jgi:hypothetical protein
MRILEKTLPMRAANSKSGFQIAKRVLADQAIMWVMQLGLGGS